MKMATTNLMIGQFNQHLLQKMSLEIIFINGYSMIFMNLILKVLLLMIPRNAYTFSSLSPVLPLGNPSICSCGMMCMLERYRHQI